MDRFQEWTEFGADREVVRLALERENIESRPIWKPMHLQPVFKGCRVRGGGVSEDLFRQGLCMPSGTQMTEEDLERVANIIRNFHRQNKNRSPPAKKGCYAELSKLFDLTFKSITPFQ
jgi:dTDP-4-amino-4,6-dideoxygalactose transaminase